MQSTIQLFRHLYDHLPPFVPDVVKQKMAHALQHLENDQTITLLEIEDIMIQFGYEVWPWNQAYKEFLAEAESQLGEHFLLPKLSDGLHKKYADFKIYGGTFRDLHSGNPAAFFTPEERSELCEALFAVRQDLRAYVDRQVIGTQKDVYLKRAREFNQLLLDIESSLNNLRDVADREQEHPSLASEIRARVRGFEYSLCLLGPELDYEAVCESTNFFHGRRQELDRMKGIHMPMAVDFYGLKN